MPNPIVGKDAAGNPIDAQGNVVRPDPPTPPGVETVPPMSPAPAPRPVPAAPLNPAVTVNIASVDGVSITLPAGAQVNSNGTVILADGTPLNPVDIIRAWRNGKTHI